MSSMSHLKGAGSCRHRFIGACSTLVNLVVSAVGNTGSRVPVDLEDISDFPLKSVQDSRSHISRNHGRKNFFYL